MRAAGATRCVPLGTRLSVLLLLLLLLLLARAAHAGGSGENVLLVVDPTVPEALHVANHYLEKRDVPAVNVLYMASGAADYAEFAAASLPGFLGALAWKGIEDHVDFVVLPSGGSFYLPAPGYVSDGCSPVTRFSATAGYTLAFRADSILDGIGSQSRNRYFQNSWEPQFFDSSLRWLGGEPSTATTARRYFIGALLGYTGPNGNTLAEVLAMIDRSVAADATHPAGTFYYMETSDPARSDPRDGAYPAAVAEIAAAGGAAQHLFEWLPLGQHDCLGVMSGFASADIDGASLTLLPGAFADHLTSFAATFDDTSQTKMTRWIAKGASGTAGTVEEPCNYAGKFPSARLHAVYFRGLTLGEAWFRSLAYEPFQDLFVGDPLTRPWADPPVVDVLDEPASAVSGTITLTPAASATAGGAGIAGLELLVDGVLAETIAGGGVFTLDTTRLDDGWHELRVLALDDTPVRNAATWKGALVVDNGGRSVSLTASPGTGDLGQVFDLGFAAAGGLVDEVQLLQNERVVASTSQAAGTLGVHAQMLGAGTVRVQALALFHDGRRARSAPVTLAIDDSGGTSGALPVAFGFRRSLSREEPLPPGPFVLELPATYDDALPAAVYTVVTPPAQASILSTGNGPWRVLRANPGALGADSMVFRVTTPAGTSGDATIRLDYGGRPVRPR
jgi:hypothetical protein